MIRLQRTVTAFTFDAEATVAVGRDRPENLAVARLAADLKRPIVGADISRELLGGLPEQVGWRVIERCLALGLFTRREAHGPAELSPTGVAALEHGAVLVPEEGLWRFWLVEDPLIDDPLVHVARIEGETARDERQGLSAAKRGERPRPGPGDGLPPPLRPAATYDRVWTSILTGKPFAVREVGPRGIDGPSSTLELVLSWAPDQLRPTVVLRGTLDGPQVDRQDRRIDRPINSARAAAGGTYESLWAKLVATSANLSVRTLEDWRVRAGELVFPATFDESLDASARNSMRRSLPIPSVQLNGLGSFESSVLDGVRLVPRTAEDAAHWADWLVWNGLENYATPSVLEGFSGAVARRFPFHQPRLPTPDDLLQRAKKAPNDPRARFLLAPADLGLWTRS